STCTGPTDIRAIPGEVVEIRACFADGDSPLSDHQVVFLQDGPSPLRRFPTATDAAGVAIFRFSSPKVGRSRVGVCDQDACMPPMLVTWASGDQRLPEDPPPPPSLTSLPCLATSTVDVPAFADLMDVTKAIGPHPKTGRDGDQIVLVTRQNFAAGAAAQGTPASIFTAMSSVGKGNDQTGPYPFRGSNRLLVFSTNGDVLWGKLEFVYDDGVWSEVSPRFTVALEHAKTTFYSDDDKFPDVAPRAGTKVGEVCDSIGIEFATDEPGSPSSETDTPSNSAVIIGIGVLALLGGLALAVMRSSQPPSGGPLLTKPSSPGVKTTRDELTFDVMGRINAYRDTLELVDGTTRTIRARVIQEDLVVDIPLLLDSSDWDDELIDMTRMDMTYDSQGAMSSYREENLAVDGTKQVHVVDNIVYDKYRRVIRYHRSTTGEFDGNRSETVLLEHDDRGRSQEPLAPLRLCKTETLRRHQIRFDSDEHVVGYQGVATTDGSGELDGDVFDAAVPKAMFEVGESFAAQACFVSRPNKGLGRMRHVLTRWFRTHGCKITIQVPHVKESAQTILNVAGLDVRVKANGHATVWALNPGNYAVSSGGHLVAWVLVKDIPGSVQVRL
ncbi:MAG: hypothetical protein ABIS18_09265, partial [Actinomycetota bacterium]